MLKAVFDEDKCKGCELCVKACPKNIVVIQTDKLNKKGYYPAGMSDEKKCTGCAMCATACPDVAIEIRGEV